MNLIRIGGDHRRAARFAALAERRLRRGRLDPRLPDRARRARRQLLRPAALREALAHPARRMKRFYKAAAVGPEGDDPARRPAGANALGRGAGAAERRCSPKRSPTNGTRRSERIDPRAMPLTGLANAAIDRVAPDAGRLRRRPRRLRRERPLCYRAEGPRGAGRAPGGALGSDPRPGRSSATTRCSSSRTGVIHMPQPPETVERLARGGRRARAVRARRAVAAGHRLGLAADRAGAGRRRDRPRTPPGPPRRSTRPGRPSNGARTPKPPPRSPPAARDFEAAARFLSLL